MFVTRSRAGGRGGGRATPSGRRWSAWRRNRGYIAELTPAAILLALFFVLPALWSIYLSLTNLSLAGFGAVHPDFVGLANYRGLWRDPNFLRVVRTTILFVLGSAVVGQVGLGLGLALLLDHAQRHGYVLATPAYAAVILAWVTPVVISGFIWARLLTFDGGTLNAILGAVGIPPVDWLGRFPLPCVIVADVWRGTAFAMLIFLGALQTVPRQVYEAARVDGAGAWRQLRDHTLPLLRPLAILALLMTTITTIASFILILTLTNGGPGFLETETLALYAYHNTFERFAIGYGSAISVVMLIVTLAFALVYLRLERLERVQP